MRFRHRHRHRHPHRPHYTAHRAPFRKPVLPFLFLAELLAKILYLRGQMRVVELSAHVKLTVGVIDPLIAFLRAEKLCEVTRRGESGTHADLTYNLTDLGRSRAIEFMARNSYAGPAPVTLDAYRAQVLAQRVVEMRITREDMTNNFADIVVSPGVLDQLGSAMNSGRAIFVHGPAGSGKTYLAERLNGLLKGTISVPYAMFVEGEVVQIHDPVVHRPIPESAKEVRAFEQGALIDTRWVQTMRPAVLTGGELTLGLLELRYDRRTGFYQAPPHLQGQQRHFHHRRSRASTLYRSRTDESLDRADG